MEINFALQVTPSALRLAAGAELLFERFELSKYISLQKLIRVRQLAATSSAPSLFKGGQQDPYAAKQRPSLVFYNTYISNAG